MGKGLSDLGILPVNYIDLGIHFPVRALPLWFMGFVLSLISHFFYLFLSLSLSFVHPSVYFYLLFSLSFSMYFSSPSFSPSVSAFLFIFLKRASSVVHIFYLHLPIKFLL